MTKLPFQALTSGIIVHVSLVFDFTLNLTHTIDMNSCKYDFGWVWLTAWPLEVIRETI